MKFKLTLKQGLISVVLFLVSNLSFHTLSLAQEPTHPRRSALCMALMKNINKTQSTRDPETASTLRILRVLKDHLFRGAQEKISGTAEGFATHDTASSKRFHLGKIAERINGILSFTDPNRSSPENSKENRKNQVRAIAIRGEKEIETFLQDIRGQTQDYQGHFQGHFRPIENANRVLGIAAYITNLFILDSYPGVFAGNLALIYYLFQHWKVVQYFSRDFQANQAIDTITDIAKSQTPNQWAYFARNHYLSKITLDAFNNLDGIEEQLGTELERTKLAPDQLMAASQLTLEAFPAGFAVLLGKEFNGVRSFYTHQAHWFGLDLLVHTDTEGTPELIVVLRYSIEKPNVPKKGKKEKKLTEPQSVFDRLRGVVPQGAG